MKDKEGGREGGREGEERQVKMIYMYCTCVHILHY